MRVAVVSPYTLSVPGGVQGQVLGLTRSLRAKGIDARVLAPCDGPPPEPWVTTVGSSIRFSSNGSIAPIAPGPIVARRTLEALRAFQPDVVHLHEPLTPGPTLSLLLAKEVPAVGTFHAAGPVPAYLYLYLKPVIRNIADSLAVRTAVSQEARARAEQWLHGTYRILPNGVEVERFAARAAQERSAEAGISDIERVALPGSTARPAIMFIGRHEPRKGLGILLDAFAALERDATLWVVGEGPETAELMARGIPGVEWLGRISDDELARRLALATVFCAPALRSESFGVILLEAMASGVPVVASDISGYREVARSGMEGLLATPGDSGALRAALCMVLDDPAVAGKLIEAGRIRAAEFSMDRLAERFIPVYEVALAGGE